MFTHILLTSDGSECALEAANIAAALANKLGSHLTLVNVFQPSLYSAPYGERVDIGIDDNYIAGLQEDALCDAVRVLDDHDVPYQSRKEVGNPAAVIVRVAEEEKCDLIVLGSRGLGGVMRFLLGSVSDRVTHHAHCPVLIVR